MTKTACILIHGLTSSPNECKHLASTLNNTNKYNSSIPLLPGHDNWEHQNKELNSHSSEVSKYEQLGKTEVKEWLQRIDYEIKRLLEKNKNENQKIILIGESMGALLALYFATKQEYTDHIDKVVILSPPLKLKNSFKEKILILLSNFPSSILNILPKIKKKSRKKKEFALPHLAFNYYPIGAAARLFKLRKLTLKSLDKNLNHSLKILLMYDDKDHHLEFTEELIDNTFYGKNITVNKFSGGNHELLLGPHYLNVEKTIINFLET